MENNECLFCKIINGEIPCTKVYENEYVLAFKDISPVTPVHVLVIPKVHISNINELDMKNDMYIVQIFKAIKEVARICEVFDTGYRVVSNCGKDAGQTINHLHFHLLGGENLGEKII